MCIRDRQSGVPSSSHVRPIIEVCPGFEIIVDGSLPVVITCLEHVFVTDPSAYYPSSPSERTGTNLAHRKTMMKRFFISINVTMLYVYGLHRQYGGGEGKVVAVRGVGHEGRHVVVGGQLHHALASDGLELGGAHHGLRGGEVGSGDGAAVLPDGRGDVDGTSGHGGAGTHEPDQEPLGGGALVSDPSHQGGIEQGCLLYTSPSPRDS